MYASSLVSAAECPRRRWWWRWWVTTVVLVVVMKSETASSDPQLHLVCEACSQFKVSNTPAFFATLNATMDDLRVQVSNQSRRFARAETSRGSDVVYGLFQCRKYLSIPDCVACFDYADFHIRNCSAVSGGRMIYDGCFLRYEGQSFDFEGTQVGNNANCGNRSLSRRSEAAFNQTLQGLLGDLVVATPKVTGFFVSTEKQVSSTGAGAGAGAGNNNATIYAVAQCVETITPAACGSCLEVALVNIQKCLPNSEGRTFDAGCFLRYSNVSFFPANFTMDIAPLLKNGGSSKNKAIVGGVAGAAGLLLLLAALLLWYQLSRTLNAAKRGRQILGSTELQGPINYCYKDLKAATKNFSEEYKLGEGGFGDVFKGILKNGNIVAVKKLAVHSAKAKEDFDGEVKLISNVHHKNVIRLLGCSSKGPDLLLVYEYMANGSLDDFLFGKRQGTLNWAQRFDIIHGMARGLAYLHDQFHVRIIHRDIKPNNILLADDYQPKLADFGLARLLPEDQTHLNTRFAGTLGYTAPEYAIHGQLSEKVDTYSYGVVVLEIISGRRSSHVDNEHSTTEYLLQQAWKLYKNNMHFKLVDKSLNPDEYNTEDVKKLVEIALFCTQSPAHMRPTMSEVVVMLISGSTTREQRSPNPPVLVDSDNMIADGNSSPSTGSSATNASVTLTDITGR